MSTIEAIQTIDTILSACADLTTAGQRFVTVEIRDFVGVLEKLRAHEGRIAFGPAELHPEMRPDRSHIDEC